jgi:hypothetical protein
MELNSFQTHQLLQRFPKIELSYETIPHKKVSPHYNVCLAIPVGRKVFLWYTFYGDSNVCFQIELNREKKPIKFTCISEENVPLELVKGTLLYGTIIDDPCVRGKHVYIMDDVLYYKGVITRGLCFKERLAILYDYFASYSGSCCFHETYSIALPIMWKINKDEDYDCEYWMHPKWEKSPPYITHHVQYRCLNQAAPHLNVIPTRKQLVRNVYEPPGNTQPQPPPQQQRPGGWSSMCIPSDHPIKMDYSKPQYKLPTIFIVSADLQFDVYHLFAFGRNRSYSYCGIANIPNYKTSVFMNHLFRKIHENDHLDKIEESDDEDDFQNPSKDKWVDLNKQLHIECVFHWKFKKWVPVKEVSKYTKVVHSSYL